MVVKLGGSHADTAGLRTAWLRVIAAADPPVVLVPGGGPFADVVRAQQPAMGYDDATAHAMALLAMAQFGLVLAAAPGFTTATSRAGIMRALAGGLTPVWLPQAMVATAPGVAQDWSVTSDSLALWLARRLHARAVLLVKRDPVRPGLDAAFAAFRARFPGEVFVAGPSDMPARLQAGALPGRSHPRACLATGPAPATSAPARTPPA